MTSWFTRVTAGVAYVGALTLGSIVVATPALAQAAECAPPSRKLADHIESGWMHYRRASLDSADAAFRRVIAVCPDEIGANNGAGYVALRRESLTVARRLFERVLAIAPADYDALVGLGLTTFHSGDFVVSRQLFTRILASVPSDSTSLLHLQRIRDAEAAAAHQSAPRRERPARTVVAARVRNRRFEIPDGRGGWRPMWIAGVNLGAALPGKHPSEFPPNDSTYERWIELFARMNSNVIRLYTIHPPHFYQALRRWNLAHPERPIWLIHGVWTELPPGAHEEQYDDSVWNDDFRAEMRHVVDLLHGSASLPQRQGRASGYYDADVSQWVLAYI
ncbi:MAG: tetratricopeptide repeat protein, partial [Gemmatimonadaceae bacterium]